MKISKAILYISLCFVFLQSFPALASERPIRVAFMVPGMGDTAHWRNVVDFMQAVAEDLNIDLQITYSRPNEISMNRKVKEILTNPENKPDYFITSRWSKDSLTYIDLADQQRIKTIAVGAMFSEADRAVVGYPRGKYKNWIGELIPRDEQVGYDLADSLIKQAKRQGVSGDKRVSILAVGAYEGDTTNTFRIEGLKRRIAGNNDATLLGVKLAGWRRGLAREVMLKAYEKYNEIDVVWAASDEMALGVCDAIKEFGQKPGEDIIVGGIDWDKENIDSIAKGEIAVSYGGIVFDTGWALILLYDYHHGIDFDSNTGRVFSLQHPVNKANVDKYKEYFVSANWRRINFQNFSKKFNPNLKEYNFSFDALIQSIKQPN